MIIMFYVNLYCFNLSYFYNYYKNTIIEVVKPSKKKHFIENYINI